jgi:hypothetical protein
MRWYGPCTPEAVNLVGTEISMHSSAHGVRARVARAERRSRALRVVWMVSWIAIGCGSGDGMRPVVPPESVGPGGDERSVASQLVVGLEVAADAESGQRLVAVVSHPDGTRETHDLGAYRGPMRELAPLGDALLRVGDQDVDEVILVPHDGTLEAMRRRPGIADETLLRIELPAGVTIAPSSPGLVLPP